jgi:hypothetical protein
MKEENKKLCEEIFGEVAERHKIKIKELSVMSECVEWLHDPIVGTTFSFYCLNF